MATLKAFLYMIHKLLLVGLVLVSGLVAAQTTSLPATAAAQLDSMERVMFNATQNAEVFGSLMGDDYITLNADGVMENKVQTLDMVRNHPLPKADTILFSDQTQRLYGTIAIRTGRAKVYKAGIVLADFIYTQTWVYRDNRWQFIGWQGTMTGWPKYYPVLITLILAGLAALLLWWVMKRRIKSVQVR